MGFTEHKIGAFTHKISDLPDQPQLTPQELKARFDSAPEELRAAHNAVCDEGEALTKRIDAYRAQTFEGEVTRDMLAAPVQEELDTLHNETAVKCACYFGTYTGDGQPEQFIELGFTPKAVLVISANGETCYNNGSYRYCYGGLASADTPCISPDKQNAVEIVENGFRVYYRDKSSSPRTMTNYGDHYYLALL